MFASVDRSSLQLKIQTLKMYEQQSGQFINKEKSFFYLFNKVALSWWSKSEVSAKGVFLYLTWVILLAILRRRIFISKSSSRRFIINFYLMWAKQS